MTAKEESACTPTDALNLLADLALSVNSDQVVAQPDQALESKPERRLKKCNFAQDVVSTEEESGLHMLTQSAARPIEPHESPSPSHVLEGSELAGLITEEHAYSLRPSASLLMTLSGTPFQVSPLRGSTRLLHHHQTMVNCDGFKYLQPIADQENKNEHNHKTLAHGEKLMVHRRKLRKFRTFIIKDGSLQVTRYWKRNYDFDRDSKFTNDSTLRSICRALHGYVYCIFLVNKEFWNWYLFHIFFLKSERANVYSPLIAHGPFPFKTPGKNYDSSSTCG